jgi:ABC-type branched-subunit amino acid transport system substrate-binding protein/predicted negative regulator of RcsB-dependent stress response
LRGRASLAEKQLREFLHAHPEDRLIPIAQLELGRLLLAKHQDGEALALFSSVTEHPEPAVAEQGRFYTGVATERLGRHAEAIETLEPMLGRTIEAEQTNLLLDTLADAYVATQKYAAAVRVLSLRLQDEQPDAQRRKLRERMFELIDQKAGPADIRQLLSELDHKSPAYRQTAVRAVRDAEAARDTDRVRELVELLRAEQIPLDEELTAIALRSQTDGGANPNAVGAILSLSGRARRVGELALRGLMQAAGLPPQGPAAPDAPSVVFRDDAGEPTRALQAVEELANVHRVIAIIGPMDAQLAAIAGRRAQELSVPLIALTPAGDIPSAGGYVFRYFPTPAAEARALATAASKRGAQSFAALYPNNAYGQAMLQAFTREASSAGIRQAAALAYAPSSTSFGNEASELAKRSFDVLFIPDSAQQVALIAPALAAAGLWSSQAGESVPHGRAIGLLVPSVGFHPSLPRLAGRYLQGANFAVPFNPQAPDGPTHDFVQRFTQAFGSEPDAFAAFAHDAYRLVRSGVEAGALTREALVEQLRTQRVSGLVAPAQGFDANREPLRAVEVLELRGGGFDDATQ